MARGMVPRQPSRSGKQAGVRRAPVRGTSPLQKQSAAKERTPKPPVKSAKKLPGLAKTGLDRGNPP